MSQPTTTTTDLQASTSLGDEIGRLARLGLPIAAAQFGMTAMGFVDIAFLGHYRPEALAAMSLGNTLSWGAIVFCLGVLTAVDPLLSQAIGARDGPAVTKALLRALLLALVLSVPAMALLWPSATWLELLGQQPALVPEAALYARLNAIGIAPLLCFQVLRSMLAAHSRTVPAVVVIVVANLANALLDWLLVFGKLGCPELGVAGAALATAVCRWFMCLLMFWLGRATFVPHLRALRDVSVRAAVFALHPLLRTVRLGAPIGGQFAMEMGVFALTAMLVGQLDVAAGDAEGLRLCGHQIALQLASLSFMVPLGLGMAASVRVGWAVGAGDHHGARRAAQAALLSGAVVMSAFMLLFLLLPRQLAEVLSNDQGAVAWGMLLIPIAGVFQIGDGLQVTAIGCLRGAGSVRAPFWINVAGFWCTGLPLGCWLAFPWGRDRGPAGLWWGLVVGLFAVAIALLVAVRLRFRELGPRLRVD